MENATVADRDAIVGAGALDLEGTGSRFTLGAAATPVAGGVNAISTDGAITIESGATIRGGSADTPLGGADASRREAGGPTSLTLAAIGGITPGVSLRSRRWASPTLSRWARRSVARTDRLPRAAPAR